ncbi:LysM peptidoglycan-binding domain-containing protein [Janibacter indicus]
MTALTAAPVRIDVRPGRPARSRHLVSVPTGDAVTGRAPASLRLTRRGRLAITTTTVLVASIAGATMAFGGPAATPQTVTVEPGQTLGQIAATELSDVPTREGVTRIQLANDLPSSHVHAGQTLTIPAP